MMDVRTDYGRSDDGRTNDGCRLMMIEVRGRLLEERLFKIDAVWICGFYMLCRLCVLCCSLR